MRLGIYIGSFNPPHIGHLDVINYLLNNKYVDSVLIVPTLGYWDKDNLIELKHRINMLKFFENDKVKIDTLHNEYAYTYLLMRALSKDYDDELYLIMGADNIVEFDKWKHYQELLKYKIIVMNRDDIDIDKYIEKYHSNNFITIKDYEYIPISSTQIRDNLDSRFIDSRVLRYIKKNNLYK